MTLLRTDVQVVVIGSANADLVVPVPRRPRAGETVAGGDLRTVPGGKGADQAVAAARLGARVAFVGCVVDNGRAGAAGAIVGDSDGAVHVPAPPVMSVDTTGAGDAFTGALAWRLADGDGLVAAVRYAVRVGATAVTRAGAQPSFLTSHGVVAVGLSVTSRRRGRARPCPAAAPASSPKRADRASSRRRP